jgi:isoquinoline 1-oxidoreductase beta subunit
MNITISKLDRTGIDRRGFLGTVFGAGAFVLAARVMPFGTELNAATLDATTGTASWQPSVYLGLDLDGTVIIVAHRSEMGTGIRTGLPMVVADELEADWKRVRIEQAIGDTKYGNQNTDGSNSITSFFEPMRVAGATARMMLESAAASKWGVPVAECKAKNHEVVHTSGKKFGYGELVATAATLPAPKKEELKYKPASEYRYIGKDFPIYDLDNIVAGKGTFGMDARVPGMVYASIERSPVIGGKVKSVDDSEALKVAGVSGTAKIEGFKGAYSQFQPVGGVAVIANNTWAAMQGRKKLKIEWEPSEFDSYDSESFKKTLQETARAACKVAKNTGDVDAAFAKGGKIIEAEYYAPHLSHAPMEPPVAVAEFKDGKVTAWCPTQNPQAVQSAVSAALGIPGKDVICNVTLLGGGFGRKSKPDYVVEAAVLSKQLGKPVKVTWTREDDIRFDYFHGVSIAYMKAAVDEKGSPTAWLQRSVFPPIFGTGTPGYGQGQIGMGFTNIPFDIPNLRIENGPAMTPVRIGWLRSVANIHHAFAIQSFVDELAAAANRDRVEYQLEVIGKPRIIGAAGAYGYDTGRLRNVLELAEEKSGWAKKKATKGRALGIATHYSFRSYIAAVVDVEVNPKGEVIIHRVDIAADPGMIVSPDRVRAQFEGAAVFGAGLTLLGEINFKDGKARQSNFNNYQVSRINQANPIETHVHIVPSTAAPAGVGEPGVPPMAPAICNAIFAATGKRIRELPVKNTKLV